jgi:hypothetical protein
MFYLDKLTNTLVPVVSEERLQSLHALCRQKFIAVVIGHGGHREEHGAFASRDFHLVTSSLREAKLAVTLIED